MVKKTTEPKTRRGSKPPAEPKAKASKPKGKNLELPGTVKRIAAIDEAAEDYAAKRDERMELTTLEVDAKEKLLGLMKKHGVEIYRLDDERVAMIEHEVETVKVKKLSVEAQARRAKRDDTGDDDEEAAAE